MLKQKQKLKWIVIVAIAVILTVILIFMPKIVDGLFSVYVCDFTALTVVDAHDVIGYVGAVFGGLCALVAVAIAVRHFSVEKRPIIIPQNKIIYYYRNFDRKYAFQDTPDMEKQSPNFTPQILQYLVLENISNSPAIEFDIEVRYHNGEWYRSICNLIGGAPDEILNSSFEDDKYFNQGVFNANSTRKLVIPINVEYITKGISYRLYEPTAAPKCKAERWDHFLRKTHKIAEIWICSQDVLGELRTDSYDMQIGITDCMDKPVYEISFTFVSKKK